MVFGPGLTVFDLGSACVTILSSADGRSSFEALRLTRGLAWRANFYRCRSWKIRKKAASRDPLHREHPELILTNRRERVIRDDYLRARNTSQNNTEWHKKSLRFNGVSEPPCAIASLRASGRRQRLAPHLSLAQRYPSLRYMEKLIVLSHYPLNSLVHHPPWPTQRCPPVSRTSAGA